MKRYVCHGALVILFLCLTILLPFAVNSDIFMGDNTDAVAQATIEIPDEPSGEYYIFINKRLHRDSINDWISFFNDDEFAVIFDDIKCIAPKGDVNGIQLAERYKAQLPENQMTLRTEDPTLLASKAEQGYIDMAVFSVEMAEAMGIQGDSVEKDIVLIQLRGGSEDAEN